jgi:hypothetical protein
LCQLPPAVSATVDAAGASVAFHVGAEPGCTWTVDTARTAAWLTVVGESSHVGPDDLAITIEPNRSYDARVGAIFVRDADSRLHLAYSVLQRGAACLYTIAASEVSLGPFGTSDGSGHTPLRFRVTAQPATCQWTATPSVSWILMSAGSHQGTGDRDISFIVVQQGFGSSPRVGVVTVAGLSGVNPNATLRVSQDGWPR